MTDFGPVASAEVPCPVCGVSGTSHEPRCKAGLRPCLSPSGTPLRKPHTARLQAIEAARAAFQAAVDALPPAPPPSRDQIARADAMIARMLGPQRKGPRPSTQLPLL